MWRRLNILFEDATGLPGGEIPTTQDDGRKRRTPPPPPPPPPAASQKPASPSHEAEPSSTHRESSKKSEPSSTHRESSKKSKKPSSTHRESSKRSEIRPVTSPRLSTSSSSPRREDISDKLRPLTTPLRKRQKAQLTPARPDRQVRQKTSRWAEFTDPTRPKYLEKPIPKFKPLKDAKQKEFDNFVKWLRIKKWDGKFMESVRLKTCDADTIFFDTILTETKWLHDSVRYYIISLFPINLK